MHTYNPITHPPNSMVWTGRVISTLCILFFLFDGIVKLINIKPVMDACIELGIPQTAIVGIGITLLTCTILYSIPQTSGLGAILLTGYLGGAIMTHVRIAGGPVFPIIFASLFGVLVWVGLFLREPRLHALIPLRR